MNMYTLYLETVLLLFKMEKELMYALKIEKKAWFMILK